MNDSKPASLQDVLRLAAEGAPRDVFIVKAREVKAEMMDEAYALHRDITLLDSLVAQQWPDEEWVSGWDYPPDRRRVTLVPMQPQTHSPSQRIRRIGEIAMTMVGDGQEIVESKTIAKQLIAEGYGEDERAMAVSAANVLARDDRWKKVRPGEYRYSLADDETEGN